MKTTKAYLNWSSGKDACLALNNLQQSKSLSVELLLTTYNADLNRVTMHGVPLSLVEAQAKSLGLPLDFLSLKGDVSMATYNAAVKKKVTSLKAEGFTASVFGDIALDDLKEYREKQYRPLGVEPIFPLWEKNTQNLADYFIDLGFKAIVIAVSAKKLDASFCGRIYDRKFLNDLPKGVDPCGENGEFDTFVYDGPNFKFPVPFKLGDKIMQSYQPSKRNDKDDCFKNQSFWDNQFWFQEVIPIDS